MGAVVPAIAASFADRNPANQIRFHTAAQADAKRQQLIRFIWPDGLPATLPTVTTNVAFPPGLNGIDRSLVSRVDMLDANVSGMDFHSVSYLIHPALATNADWWVIVHHGHVYGTSEALTLGISDTANRLLRGATPW